ncbi:HAMP domain-containing histidine kinase [Sphingomonas sp. SUN019]|uniref:sensor histidine kinase n=1 Tax=Sphingomonas sp. SUN019 TaxID=2937788 RepID=UPI002164286A|nr:HAMP domain-containing sensor histidine kinase [Sphingomonas sp. SUN019]UVO50697.1 HAMP domain-containing histidine kinase [Sphingomonas sp. SUN019]
MNWRSTTLRFALLVFILQVAAGIALLGLTGAVVRQEIEKGAALRAETLRDDLLVTYGQGGLPALADEVRARTERIITPDAVLLLVDSGGKVVAGNLTGPPPHVAIGPRHALFKLVRAGHAAPEAMWVRATPLAGGARLLTGSVVESQQRILDYLERSAVAGLTLAVLFAALAAWLAARLIAHRLRATVDCLEAVREGDLGRRVENDRSGDAFAALAGAVNMTLERIEGLVGELQIATDGLAHDLKSPLTRLRSALERAAIDVREPAAQQAVGRALGEGERVLAIVETALRISRAEAGVGRDAFRSVDLVSELNDIAEVYGPVVEDAGRAIAVDAPVTAALAVHRELLGQAIGNLVDNALKYGEGPITLRLEVAPGAVTIAVEDRGRGIPPGLRAQALSRFGRLDAARRGSGAGLGLALVGAVARLHGGAITLADAGPGLSVRIVLPVGPADPAAS